MVEQQRHRMVYVRVVDQVIVVQSDDSRAGECIQVVDEAGHYVLDREAAFGAYQRQRLGPNLRAGGLYCSHEVGEKRPQVGVGRVEGQPPDPRRVRCSA